MTKCKPEFYKLTLPTTTELLLQNVINHIFKSSSSNACPHQLNQVYNFARYSPKTSFNIIFTTTTMCTNWFRLEVSRPTYHVSSVLLSCLLHTATVYHIALITVIVLGEDHKLWSSTYGTFSIVLLQLPP
jgi:hypothetical protein